MWFTRGALGALVLLTFFGCASQSDLESVRRDNDEIKNRLFTLDRGLNEVRGEVKEGVEKSLAGYRQSLEALQADMAGYQKEMASIRKGGADLQATLESARVDMQLLTGKVDDVRILAQKPADDIALLKEDLNKRLAALEARMTKLEKGIEEQQAKAAAALKSPEQLYQQGQDALKAGQGAKAREFFASFLVQYPKHSLAANAQYWIGESYYQEKNYEQAVLEFQEVIKNYPDKEKAPAAMLKQGMAFRELGDSKSAAYILKKLVDEHPKSEEAKIARDKFKIK
ncbi:tol-pal system protein YbgF [Geomonas sp. Red69]|uniref:Tol-pal system protein YbgF n=1 Tax=Geomonas diazotrophica TaxID=2843197 RepID=A0ABX8JIB2_9BACT|nr:MULTISPECIES: tol-pal system protein YbgF [Geomonas]MBU5635955.1 tol-pal system protein YbgF [Geomonas diazotrophica]QWV96866.1 tol-pal system protein YbgF [Geomonas nitrogeniifigens]QXE86031.1 tol-pal system protein YbgF [Geomonas nitrogeniifigens]